MLRSRLLQLASVVTVAAVSAAYAAPAGAQADRGNKDGQLVIGSLAPETGDLSAILDSLRLPVGIAVDEINAAGGVNGQPVKEVTGDDGTDPQVASQTLDRLLTSDKVDAIMGPASSSTALGIIDKIKTNAVLTCSGSTTSADLSKPKAGGYFFRTAPPDRLQGPALAELVLSDGHSKVGILTRNDSYGVGFGKALNKALKQGGAKVVQTMIAKGIGPGDVPLYTADGMQSSKFATTLDPSDASKAEGIKGTAPAGAPAGIQSPFQPVFAAKGVDPIFSAYYYDCTILTALAAVKAKSDDPAKLKKNFTANLKGKEDCDTFADCKTLLEDGKTIHWRGASSKFDKFGKTEPNQGVYDVWSYDTAGKVQTEDP